MKFNTPKLETTQLTSFKRISYFDFVNITVQDVLDGNVTWKNLFPEFTSLFEMLKDQLNTEGFCSEDFKSWECPMWGHGEEYSTLLCFESNKGDIDVWIELKGNQWVMQITALDEENCTVERDFKTIQEVMDAYKANN